MWAHGLNGITLGALDHDGLSLVRVTLGSFFSIIYPQAGKLISTPMHKRPAGAGHRRSKRGDPDGTAPCEPDIAGL